MSKVRFPARLSFWASESTAAAFEQLAANSNLAVSDFLRDAADGYVRARGLLAPQNGGQHHQAAE
jgi:hypothetical protein